MIYYGANPKSRFLGAIPLKGVTIERDVQKKSGKDHCFVLHFEKRKPIWIYVESETEMEQWITGIQKTIDKMNKQK
jgi:hypothetical protein